MTKTVTFTCDICGKTIESYDEKTPWGWVEMSGISKQIEHRCPECINKPDPNDEICTCGHYRYKDHYPEIGKNLPCEICDCQEFTSVKEKN